jgi:hypothetical protein
MCITCMINKIIGIISITTMNNCVSWFVKRFIVTRVMGASSQKSLQILGTRSVQNTRIIDQFSNLTPNDYDISRWYIRDRDNWRK